ncbi:MAG: hypothetical protein IKI84_15235 [Clostridia bacterium]|nr:hypothetical protein [Clostridia bacterium]
MYGIRITPEPDWSVDTDMLSAATPPEKMWLCTERGASGQTPRFVYVGDRPCVMLYEQPGEEQIPEGCRQPVVFYRFPSEALGGRFYLLDGQWLVENTWCPDDPDAWLDRVNSCGGDSRVCLRWVGPEWFEQIRTVCSQWYVPLYVPGNALTGWKSVEYAWRRGGPPGGKAIFLVSRFGENDYLFSDGTLFFYAHLMNPWEWISGIDEPRWHTYKRLEDLLIRHCYRNRSLVPLEGLPTAFSSFILHHLPTTDFVWFMVSREEGYSGTVFLIARYGEHHGCPGEVRSLELLVGEGESDPAARKLTLISGNQDDIFNWLRDADNRNGIVLSARRMLAEYEENRNRG